MVSYAIINVIIFHSNPLLSSLILCVVLLRFLGKLLQRR